MDQISTPSQLSKKLQQGADNLFLEHMQLQSGDSCLIVLEPDESLYEEEVAQVLTTRCHELGADVTVIEEPLVSQADHFPTRVADLMRQVDHTLFLSRLGDYVRFIELPGTCTKTTSYTYNTALLASAYATVPCRLMRTLHQKLEAELMAAKNWRICCPLGTDLSGTFCWPSLAGGEDDELLVTLFPVTTFKPVPCHSASGTVALSRWLMPGGAPKVEPAGLNFSGTVLCEVSDGAIQTIGGAAESADRVNKHYDHVATALGINRNRVHSWHLGMNPQTFFPHDADEDLDRWSAISFGSPRYLHFHTCGDEPPGEIAWSLFNCSVTIDGETFWEDGEFVWLQRDENRQLIESYPGAEPLLLPSRCIGVS